MDKFEVSLAEILGIENEYDLLNKQAKVSAQTKSITMDTSILYHGQHLPSRVS